MLGIFLPFIILSLDFKSKEELQSLPQTVEEHIMELEGSDDESSDDDDEAEGDLEALENGSIIEVRLHAYVIYTQNVPDV